VLPIRVGDGEMRGISFNTVIPDVRTRSLEETVELILNRLRRLAPEKRDARAAPVHAPHWPNEPTPFELGLADRTKQWSTIQRFMTADAAKRILMLKGPSGYGKSAPPQRCCPVRKNPPRAGRLCGFQGNPVAQPN
jgi:hypothetical protein